MDYYGNCVNLDGDLISKMVDSSIEIDYEDIRKHIHQKELRLLFPGYDWNIQGGLQLHNDHAVSFHKSTYKKVECVFVKWSSIEFVWVN